jgi:hypothetical protein
MIAPLRETEPGRAEVRSRLRAARRLIAATLLGPSHDPAADAPLVPAWQAWLLAVWVAAVALACGAYLLGLLC